MTFFGTREDAYNYYFLVKDIWMELDEYEELNNTQKLLFELDFTSIPFLCDHIFLLCSFVIHLTFLYKYYCEVYTERPFYKILQYLSIMTIFRIGMNFFALGHAIHKNITFYLARYGFYNSMVLLSLLLDLYSHYFYLMVLLILVIQKLVNSFSSSEKEAFFTKSNVEKLLIMISLIVSAFASVILVFYTRTVNRVYTRELGFISTYDVTKPDPITRFFYILLIASVVGMLIVLVKLTCGDSGDPKKSSKLNNVAEVTALTVTVFLYTFIISLYEYLMANTTAGKKSNVSDRMTYITLLNFANLIPEVTLPIIIIAMFKKGNGN